MIRLLHKLRSLHPAGRVMLLRIAVVLPLTALSVRLLGLQLTQSALAFLARRFPLRVSRDDGRTLARARHLVRYTRQHGPFRGNCLSRSLVLWWLLRRADVAAYLRIGVRAEGEFLAHAWVEVEGRPVNAGPRVHERFVPFDTPFLPKGAHLA